MFWKSTGTCSLGHDKSTVVICVLKSFVCVFMFVHLCCILPSILLSTALWRSGFCTARRFLSSLAQTMKAFMGLRIRDSPPAFPSTLPRIGALAWVESGLLGPVPQPGPVPVLASVRPPAPTPRFPEERGLCSKPCPGSDPGLGVAVHGRSPLPDREPAS